jgi:hypothetical protein
MQIFLNPQTKPAEEQIKGEEYETERGSERENEHHMSP